MNQPTRSYWGILISLFAVTIILWLWAFPNKSNIIWTDVFIGSLYLVLFLVAYFLLANLMIPMLEAGIGLIVYTFLIDLLDEFTFGPELWGDAISALRVIGFFLVAAGLYITQKRLRDELIRTKESDMALKQRNIELTAIHRAGQALTSTLDRESVLEAILDKVLELLDATACSIWLIDPESKELVCHQAASPERHILQGWRLPLSEGIVGWTACTGESVVITDAQQDPRHYERIDDKVGIDIRSILGVPLIVKEKTIGVLEVVDTNVNRFGQKELELVKPLAQTAAIAIENARLYEETDQLRLFNESIVQGVNDGILSHTHEGIITFTNKRLDEMLNYGYGELIGKHWHVIVPPGSIKDVEQETAKRPHNKAGRYESFLLRKDGSQVRVLISARPLFEDGQWIGVLALFTDITEILKLQKQLEQHQRLAAVGQLAAGIAHDFNNILASVIIYADILLRAPDIAPAHKKRIEVIRQQGNHAAVLIQQILDFGRKGVIEPVHLDLVPFLNDMVNMFRRTLPEDINVRLVHGSGEYVVNVDPTRMQQVVMNLALNSRDAMQYGGELVFELSRLDLEEGDEPHILGMEPGEWVCLKIQDTGIGILPENIPRIFEPFYTTKEVGKGTGLGLAQVYGIIRQHGGHICVNSQFGKGTIFNIFLQAPALPKGEGYSEEEEMSVDGNQEVILLVEDDSTTREAFSDVLKSLNYHVLMAENGEMAVNLFSQNVNGIDLVLSEVFIAEMEGKKLFQSLIRIRPDVKIVAVSGYPEVCDMDEINSLSVVGWLQKPINLDQLARTVALALGKLDGNE